MRRYLNIMWESDDYKRLIGAPLRSVQLIDDGERLRFTLADDSTLTYTAEGDCCSSSWVEHITVPGNLEGAIITEVKESASVEATDEQIAEMEMADKFPDSVSVYHTAFVTDRGEIIVEYRNNSNGYYGGWLQGPEEFPE